MESAEPLLVSPLVTNLLADYMALQEMTSRAAMVTGEGVQVTASLL